MKNLTMKALRQGLADPGSIETAIDNNHIVSVHWKSCGIGFRAQFDDSNTGVYAVEVNKQHVPNLLQMLQEREV